MPARPPSRNLPIAPGGVLEELGVPDPRIARRRAAPIRGRAAQDPPPDDRISEDDFFKLMEIRPFPGRRKASRSGRVMVGHRVVIDGHIAFCHAFTITRTAYDALRSGQELSAQGATWPNGLPVVPKGADPTSVTVRCASCGGEQIACREMVFYWE
jgi:hypothetical protein